MRVSRPTQWAASVWELVRPALLLLVATRAARGALAALVPLLVPLAAPGLALAAGFAAVALVPEASGGIVPLLRLGKSLELGSSVCALILSLLAGPALAPETLLALAVAAGADVVFLWLAIASGRRSAEPE